MATKKKSSAFAKLPAEDKALTTVGYIVLATFCFLIILPMAYVILASFIDPVTLQN